MRTVKGKATLILIALSLLPIMAYSYVLPECGVSKDKYFTHNSINNLATTSINWEDGIAPVDGDSVTVDKNQILKPKMEWNRVGMLNALEVIDTNLEPKPSLYSIIRSSDIPSISGVSESFQFNGIDSYLTIDDPDIDLSGGYSIGLWIKTEDTTGEHVILSKYDSEQGGITLTLTGIALELEINTPGGTVLSYSSPITVNNWHHVELSYNSTTYYLFIDGSHRAMSSASGKQLPITNSPLYVGASNKGGLSNFFNGKITGLSVGKRDAPYHWVDFTPPVIAPSNALIGISPPPDPIVEIKEDLIVGKLIIESGTTIISDGNLIIDDTYYTVECNDGNNNSFDGCTNSCKAEWCGDGIPQPHLGETCDRGIYNGIRNGVCASDCTKRNVCRGGRGCRVVYKQGTSPCRDASAPDKYYVDVDGEGMEQALNSLYLSYDDVVVCPGTYKGNPVIMSCGGHISAWAPPTRGYQSGINDAITGESTDFQTIPPKDTDTILMPRHTGKHGVQLRYGCSHRGRTAAEVSSRGAVFQGFRIQNNWGSECAVYVNSSTPQEIQPCSGVRVYCTAEWTVMDNVFENNRIGFFNKDTDPYWEFYTSVYQNLFYNNLEGARIQYGNHISFWNNTAFDNNTGLHLIDTRYDSVTFNNFENYTYNVDLTVAVYPIMDSNIGTVVQNNNFYIRDGYVQANYNSEAHNKDDAPDQRHWQGNFYENIWSSANWWSTNGQAWYFLETSFLSEINWIQQYIDWLGDQQC